MKKDGKVDAGDAQVLHWQGRVLCADDLRRNLNGHRELVLLPGTVITPLAADEIRKLGIRIDRQEKPTAKVGGNSAWGYAQERIDPVVTSVMQSLAREGLQVKLLQPAVGQNPSAWAKAIADCVARNECKGGLVFCADPGLVCCVANKVKGLRAAAANNIQQAVRAANNLGANLIAIEMPGQTFFEIRQIVRCLCKPSECPGGVATVLQELDGHAHR
ncbi:MAG TPA: RpiB/LacA/LacB family sugar-phosphate isomerase [Gemmataceae bacterium]|nr:RpiB/LacA/LacB family sugar-phosphate isomerase [Gemmataceae bacterium]